MLVVVLLAVGAHAQNECALTDSGEHTPPSPTSRSQLYRGEQSFTLNMLRAINQTAPHGNVFYSPYSTYHALLLAYFGAAGRTEQELRDVLQLNWARNKNEVFQAYRLEKQLRRLRDQNAAITFRSVDKVYVTQDTKFEPCMEELFANEFETLNFRGDPEQSRAHINEFVANVTDDNIKDVLTEGQITSATNLVIANAAFFKGDWQSQFDAKDTNLSIFYQTSEKRELVPMMHRTGMYNHAVNERLGCHVLEMPYVGDETEISMVILLPPNMPEALEGVLSRLTPEALEMALGEGMAREVEVKLPKFSFEKTYQLVSVSDFVQFDYSRWLNRQPMRRALNQPFPFAADPQSHGHQGAVPADRQSERVQRRSPPAGRRRAQSENRGGRAGLDGGRRHRHVQLPLVAAAGAGPVLLRPSVHVPDLRLPLVGGAVHRHLSWLELVDGSDETHHLFYIFIC